MYRRSITFFHFIKFVNTTYLKNIKNACACNLCVRNFQDIPISAKTSDPPSNIHSPKEALNEAQTEK
jgi:hypothetical protein